ncbi:SLC13 family permease [Epidermidibacterium keratini]|uniref:SLC13 family permease n=1 Tax=Epidermidibacterium keratini TaxID=1891644 RepID=A0A7L4YP30_9ACTN|nr:SLC13 family permease [Epidermidibacterium keratini]QHC01035.1 SLC13 family permease [Epidermidibacterium keratini]
MTLLHDQSVHEQSQRTFHRTTPLPGEPQSQPRQRWRPERRLVISAIALLALGVLLTRLPGDDPDLSADGRTTLVVFAVAVWAWVFTKLDDTFVALAAGVSLVLLNVVDSDTLFATLGSDTIWLLVSAFVIAAGVTSSGLAVRAAAWLVSSARSVRGLVHFVTTALVVTAFAVPSTSGRAALTLPVFIAIAAALGHARHGDRYRRVILVLALVFPTVILLSAVASLLGAGAHLVTSQVLQTATGEGFDFVDWMVLGLPLAVVSSHLAAELVLWLFARRDDRRQPVEISLADLQTASATPISGPLTVRESRAALILVSVIVLWCTEPLHGLHPAIVALLGALVTTSPRYGSTTLKKTLASVPWSLLLFMAATLALGDALITSGAAEWIAGRMLSGLGLASPVSFMVAVVVLSTVAHLVIQSRSARSAVLIPIVVALAPTMGVNPAAAAFASTAAAGFCHTLPSSAKPVAMFSDVDDTPTYRPADLRRLSIFLAPLMIALVLLFSFFVWPLLGLSL